MWLIWTSKRRTCIDNMSVVLSGSPSDKHVRRTARKAFHQFGKGIVDFLGFANIDPRSPRLAGMQIDGWEHLTAGLGRGKGVILATGHFGSSDMGGVTLASRTEGFYAVADTFHPPYVDRLIRRTREKKGFHLIPTSSVREIIRALHQNALVVVLFDRPLPLDEGVPVRFFGRETALPAGAAVMARHTGAAVVPAYIFREDDNSCRGVIYAPVSEDSTGDKDRDVRVVTQRLADSLEAAVRRQPDQWYMFRSMWPRPAPEPVATELHEATA